MTHLRSFRSVKSLVIGLLLLSGCSGRSTWIEPPQISADESAQQAMELYDIDKNGTLDGAELEEVPALKAAIQTLDTDGDDQVSKNEIAERIRSWQEYHAGLTSIVCDVTMDGQPLPGATVTFEPETFLGDDMQTAVGVTTRHGVVSPSIPREHRPNPDTPSGLQLGFYRVRISKLLDGEEAIPSKYNSETILGQQVAGDDPAVMGRTIRFDLKQR